MIHKLCLPLLLLCACQAALAEPLTTPSAITHGAPATTELNSLAPKTIVKSNGVEIGWLHDKSTSYELFVMTAKDVIVPLTTTYNGDMMYGMVNANTHLRYQTSDCTGQAYASLRLDGSPRTNQELAKTTPLMLAATTTTTAAYYSLPPTSVMTLQSKIDSSNNCDLDVVTSSANPVFLNDSTVTGVQFTTRGTGNPVLENLTTETR